MFTLALLAALLLLLPSPSSTSLEWQRLENPDALCNDFSRAGYFLETFEESSKWIVFLESGGLCYSPSTCNRRFFAETKRKEGNITETWKRERARGSHPSGYINPYVTSLETFNSALFMGKLEANGTDLLDRDCTLNPFCDYNMVLVPYCSSDLWLANNTGSDSSDTTQEQFLEQFDPAREELQFAFRGRVIFQSVIQELIDDQNLLNGSDLILAGSSAGGVGAVNHAKWVRNRLSPNTNLSIIADSSWFVNFKDVIYIGFDGSLRSGRRAQSQVRNNSLLSLISDIPQCMDISYGYPCCLSLTCMLREEKYFPMAEVPTIVLSSLYDVFLLAYTINRTLPIGTKERESDVPNIGIQFLITVSEYGGVMNNTLRTTSSLVPNHRVSYIATHCFQHIYLATSTLWNPGSVFGNESMEELSRSLGNFNTTFDHTISSGVWTRYNLSSHNLSMSARPAPLDVERLSSCNTSQAENIRDALGMWMICRNRNVRLTFSEPCYRPQCNPSCPDRLTLATINANRYPDYAQIVVTVWVIAVTVISILTKLVFYAWEKLLFWKQQLYLDSMNNKEDEEQHDGSGVPEFPILTTEEAISVAASNLHYEVETLPGKKVKDERLDSTSVSLAINDSKVLRQLSEMEREDGENDTEAEESNPIDNFVRTFSQRFNSRRSSERSRKHTSLRDFPMGSYMWHERRPSAISEKTTSTRLTSTSDANYVDPNIIHRTDSNGQHLQQQESSGFSTQFSDKSSDAEQVEDGSDKSRRRKRSINSNKSTVPLLTSLPAEPTTPNVEPITPTTEQGDLPDGHDAMDTNCCHFRRRKKAILKGISLYFNPGELVGIMGPSGSGKTTFLDLLTGRRKHDDKGEIYVNGCPMNKVRAWYIANTGYVLQLATPYYEELTVRENLTLAANMKLGGMTWRERFQRVEQVIEMSGLKDKENTVVGGSTGPGLSGGQKKRLTIALQLLKMPRVLFLDEPTSGLDATASHELLVHLNNLAASNRTVVLTIHQPRFEIFYMFHKLVLISDGRVAYHGIPQNAYAVFVEALRSRLITRKMVIPELEDRNPADVIMDMLGKPKMRKVILQYYIKSHEPTLVEWAIQQARQQSVACEEKKSRTSRSTSLNSIEQATKVNRQANFFDRLAVLEARASLKTTLIWRLYLPVIFLSYGILLGTVYWQTEEPLLIISGFCVYSVASALFMFPALHNYYLKALEVYRYENGDGVGKAVDLVLQGFTRFVTRAIIPVVVCALVLYMLLVKMRSWDWSVFGQLVIVNMALNQTWVALLIFVLTAAPNLAFRLSPIISSVAGFTSGFFIAREKTQWWYRWLFYINPNYYGFSSSANLLLSNFTTTRCNGSQIECFVHSPQYILKEFNFDDIYPYMHIAILLLMTHIFLVLAILANWLHHTTIVVQLKNRLRHSRDQLSEPVNELPPPDYTTAEVGSEEQMYSPEELEGLTPAECDEILSGSPDDGVFIGADDDFVKSPTPTTPAAAAADRKMSAFDARKRWKQYAKASMELSDEEQESPITRNVSGNSHPSQGGADQQERPQKLFGGKPKRKLKHLRSFYMGQEHEVFTGFSGVVEAAMQQRKAKTPTPLPTPAANLGLSLRERQLAFDDHVKVTQDIFKEQTEELIHSQESDSVPKKKVRTLAEVARRIQAQQSRSPRLASIVKEVMNSPDRGSVGSSAKSDTDRESTSNQSHPDTPAPYPSSPYRKLFKRQSHRSLSSEDLTQAIHIDELRSKVRKREFSASDANQNRWPSGQRRMSIPSAVEEEDSGNGKPGHRVHFLERRPTDLLEVRKDPREAPGRPILKSSLSVDSGQSAMSRSSSQSSTMDILHLDSSPALPRSKFVTPSPVLPNIPESFQLDEKDNHSQDESGQEGVSLV